MPFICPVCRKKYKGSQYDEFKQPLKNCADGAGDCILNLADKAIDHLEPIKEQKKAVSIIECQKDLD
jgi:hypothetical protein